MRGTPRLRRSSCPALCCFSIVYLSSRSGPSQNNLVPFRAYLAFQLNAQPGSTGLDPSPTTSWLNQESADCRLLHQFQISKVRSVLPMSPDRSISVQRQVTALATSMLLRARFQSHKGRHGRNSRLLSSPRKKSSRYVDSRT